MTSPDSGPKTLTGNPLIGHRLAFNIYTDEAGTSRHERVRIVASLIVDTSAKWRAADTALREVIMKVPQLHRNGFVSHAKSIWGDHKLREGWPKQERVSFLKEILEIPRNLGIPFAIGKVKADSPVGHVVEEFIKKSKIGLYQFEHLIAFNNSVARADYYIRHYCEADEVATLIAEDVPDLKKLLRKGLAAMKDNPMWIMGSQYFAPNSPALMEWAITQIVDGVHFVDKKDSPLLQISDALAFAFRRWLSTENCGEALVRAAVGNDVFDEQCEWDHWQGPSSAVLFRHGLGEIKRLLPLDATIIPVLG
jgi:Protein of unknown function (DUF3800)